MSIEAMKQWLKALEVAQDNLRPHGDNCFLHDKGEYNRCFCGKDSLSDFLQEQVESLSQAIEQAEKQEPVLKPCWYESKEKTMCRKCGQVHAEAIPPAAQPAPTQEHQINQLEKFKNHVLANANALGVVLDAPAAPVQEPVAWLSRRYVDNFPASGYETAQPTDYGAFPVYTTPQPQREWVGLTPTDIADALGPCPKYFSEWTDADVIYFARTLDAKLKEKNT